MGAALNIGLRAKIVLLTAAVMLLALGALSVTGTVSLSGSYAAALESRSLAIAQALRVQLDRLLQLGLTVESLVGFEDQCQEAVATYQGVEQAMVVNPEGVILFHNDPARMGARISDPRLVAAAGAGEDAIVQGSQDMVGMVTALVPIAAPSGETVAAAAVVFPDSLVADEMRHMLLWQGVTGAGFLVVALVLLQGALSAFVTRPVSRLIGEVERMEGRPLEMAEPLQVDSPDEIGRLAASFNRLLAGLRQSTVSRQELERKNAEIEELSEMSQMLLMALTLDEAYRLVPRFMHRLLPDASGELYVFSASRNRVELKVHWRKDRDEAAGEAYMSPDDCWALRRARVHIVNDPVCDAVCPHVERGGGGGRHLCAPLGATGEIIGLLHLEFPHGRDVDASVERLAGMLAEQLSFAVANLQLREALRNQSMRDALTGLYNRRYLEETLERELVRAKRAGTPLSAMMVDVDHFKRVNDTFGHEAGDRVLRVLASALVESVRGSDIVCRLGGEEFVVLLPGADESIARIRAESLRESVRRLELEHGGRALGRITVSAGVATYPVQVDTATALLAAADEALYAAKAAGRDRVMIATGQHQDESPVG